MKLRSRLGLTSLLSAVAIVATGVMAPVAANASLLDDISKAIADGKSSMNFRYRFEGVDQQGKSKEAGASTLRSRYTFTSAATSGFKLGIETDYVSVIGSERYNSTVNKRTSYPVVADPKGLDLNQAYITYNSGSWTGTFGRQRIVLGDQRFVGGVAWRQNEQTYDAAPLVYKPSATLTLDYATPPTKR